MIFWFYWTLPMEQSDFYYHSTLLNSAGKNQLYVSTVLYFWERIWITIEFHVLTHKELTLILWALECCCTIYIFGTEKAWEIVESFCLWLGLCLRDPGNIFGATQFDYFHPFESQVLAQTGLTQSGDLRHPPTTRLDIASVGSGLPWSLLAKQSITHSLLLAS